MVGIYHKAKPIKIAEVAPGCLRSDSDAEWEQTLPGHLGRGEKRTEIRSEIDTSRG